MTNLVGNTRRLAAAMTLALSGTPLLACAQEAARHPSPTDMSNAGLIRLIEQQSQRIATLEARLATLEDAAGEGTPAGQAQEADSVEARLATLEADQARQPKVNWSKGAPEFASADGKARFRPRGRFFVDASSTGGSDHAQRNLSGTEIRSARLGVEGRYGALGYVVEGEFAGNTVAWKSAYAAFDHRLFGHDAEFSVGHRLNERGLDGSSSTANTPFQSRNLVGTVLMPQRGSFGLGLMQKIHGANWHAALQVSGNSLDNPGEGNDGLTYALRAHWNPVRSDAATLHLGGWAFHEEIRGTARVLRSAAIAGPFNDQVRIGSGRVQGAERGDGYGLELAGFSGPFWAYAEWGRRGLKGHETSGDYNRHHDAHALSMGWFLRGAGPAYSAKAGTWGRVKVADPVTAGGGGAWELKARYEAADYRDLPGGGQGSGWTVGTNWYLNDWSRVMLDAVRWRSENRSGAWPGLDRGYTVNLRFQLAF